MGVARNHRETQRSGVNGVLAHLRFPPLLHPFCDSQTRFPSFSIPLPDHPLLPGSQRRKAEGPPFRLPRSSSPSPSPPPSVEKKYSLGFLKVRSPYLLVIPATFPFVTFNFNLFVFGNTRSPLEFNPGDMNHYC